MQPPPSKITVVTISLGAVLVFTKRGTAGDYDMYHTYYYFAVPYINIYLDNMVSIY